MPVTLRPARPEDEPFLYELYRSTRAEEMAAWGLPAAQQEALLKMQFNAQHQSYKARYVDADHSIILVDAREAGRIIVDRTGSEILLVDIALLREYRDGGIGSALIDELLDESRRTNKPVNLHVTKTNRAARLYERKGFVITGDDGVYYRMEWLPAR
jgi:ribosomal protein S18 acetylase RimI-like enzyme